MSPPLSPLSPGTHTTTINSLTINYTILASSPGLPPLVIHPSPWGCGAEIYIKPFSRLSSEYTLIIPFPRGNDTSQSPEHPSDMSSRHIVSDLEALRQQLDLPKINLLGHSSGGTIALGYSIAHPDSVDKLVLLASDLLGYTRRDRSFFEEVGRIQASGPPITTDAEFREFVLRIMPLYFARPEKGGPEAFRRAWTSTPSFWAYGSYYGADGAEEGKWDQVAELGKVSAQTLVVVGRQDRTAGVEISETIAAGVRGSKLVVVEECGHMPWVEQEKEFWKVLEAFLAE